MIITLMILALTWVSAKCRQNVAYIGPSGPAGGGPCGRGWTSADTVTSGFLPHRSARLVPLRRRARTSYSWCRRRRRRSRRTDPSSAPRAATRRFRGGSLGLENCRSSLSTPRGRHEVAETSDRLADCMSMHGFGRSLCGRSGRCAARSIDRGLARGTSAEGDGDCDS
jgi:hypothetical protein